MTLCSKPGCPAPGAAILAYDYAERTASLHDPIEGDLSPHLYVLCRSCAEKITPPRGWTIDDRRAKPPLFLERLEDRRSATQAAEAAEEPPEAPMRQLFFGSSA